MQKAAEDLRNEAMQKAAEKEKYINDRVPILKTEGLGQCMLNMHESITRHSDSKFLEINGLFVVVDAVVVVVLLFCCCLCLFFINSNPRHWRSQFENICNFSVNLKYPYRKNVD